MSRNDTGDRIIRHDEDEGGPKEEPRDDGQGVPPGAESTGELWSRPGGSSTMGRGGDVIQHSPPGPTGDAPDREQGRREDRKRTTP